MIRIIFRSHLVFILLLCTVFPGYTQNGKFELPNMKLIHPLTTFDSSNTVEKVRIKILDDSVYFKIYKKIKNLSFYHDQIDTFPPSDAYYAINNSDDLNTIRTKVQTCAKHARSQAFVALIGVDENGDFGNIDTIRKYYEFATRSLFHLEDNKKIFRKQHSESSHLYRAEELIYALQAYDMLRAVKNLYPDEFTDDMLDIIGGKLSSRRKDRHLQYYTRNLFRKSSGLFGIFINHDNHPLIVSAALGMSSIVLHDRGSNRKRQYQWQPKEWANYANWYINNRLWTNENWKLSHDNGHSGYSEGPGYYKYAFTFLLPYFLTFDNAFKNDIQMEFCKHANNCETVRNYLHDPKYTNLANWFNTITLDNYTPPTYDDTSENEEFPMLAITRKTNLFKYNIDSLVNLINLDILVSCTSPSVPVHNPSTILPKSGNAIYRTAYNKLSNTINPGRHYFHLLFEPKNARYDLNWWSTNFLPDYNPSTHEHDDMGSFIISANEVPLVIDPPYSGFSLHEEVLYGYQHNSLLIKHSNKYEGSSYKSDNAKIKVSYFNPRYRTIELSYELDRLDIINIKHKLGDAKRTVEVFNDEDPNTEYYYVVTDYVKSLNNNSNIRMTINGNGVYSDLSVGDKHRFNWVPGSIWGILVENSSLKNVPIYSTELGFSGSNSHTRQNIDVTGKEAKFLTIYRPYLQSVGIPELSVTTNTNDYTSSYIDSIGNDLQIHSHFIKHNKDSIINISNPFGLDTSSYIRTDAQGGFLFLSHNNYNTKRCVSNTNFRKADIKTGRFLSYYDSINTKYISTEFVNIEWDSSCFNKTVTTYYELMSKFKYRGVTFIENNTCANVSYYLPDLEPGYPLNVIDEITGAIIPSHYNSSSKTITVNFEKYMTRFIIQLKDPCMLGCYFPPTSETIDTIFNFDNGTKEVLTDDLDIIQPNGFLDITNGSVMDICENVAFVNSDSLVLTGNPPEYIENYDSEGTLIGIDTITSISKIIVNNNSTLILDSTSVTNLNVNSQILIKSGGTLLIKSGAQIIIGGKNTDGIANILVEDSAYLCIEEGANISFYDLKNEYIEENYFRVVFLPNPHSTYEATNLSAANNIFSTGGRFENSICLNLCSLGFAGNPYGVSNVEYGWSNFIKSKALIKGDSLFCKNEEIILQASRSLNETEYYLKKYTYSNSLDTFVLYDSTFNYGRINNFSASNSVGLHKIILIINNDCLLQDTIEHIYTVVDSPIAIFSIDTTNICPGYFTLFADGSKSSIGEHEWSVERMPIYEQNDISTIVELDELDDNESENGWGAEWKFTGNVDSVFNFPGYRFEGGYKYVIGLTVKNICGLTVNSYDTITVGPGVDIYFYDSSLNKNLDVDTVIFHALNPSSSDLKLKGFATKSTVVKWYDQYWNLLLEINPSNTYLDESKIAVGKKESMMYYCIAQNTNCSDTDSIYVIVNNFNMISNSDDNIICKGEGVQLFATNYEQMYWATYTWENEFIVGNSENYLVELYPDTSTTVKLTMQHDGIVEIDYYRIIVQDSIKGDINILSIDSLVCFVFEIENKENINKVYWDFRDGSNIDSNLYTCHIFPNDTVSSYYICLKLINECQSIDTCFWINISSISNTPIINTLSQGLSSNISLNEFDIEKLSEIKFNEGEFSAYPNPFFNFLRFNYKSRTNESIFIYDILGKLVDEIKINSDNRNYLYFNTSSLKPGVYFARQNSRIIKLVKN